MSTSSLGTVLRRSAVLLTAAALLATAAGCADQNADDVQAQLIGEGFTTTEGAASAAGPQAALQGIVVREGSCLMIDQSDQGGDAPSLVVPVFPQESLELTGDDPVFTDHDGGSVTLTLGRSVSFGGGYREPGNHEGIARGNGCAERDLFIVHAAG